MKLLWQMLKWNHCNLYNSWRDWNADAEAIKKMANMAAADAGFRI